MENKITKTPGKRKAHWLKPIKGKSKPSRVIFVDTETTQHPLSERELHHVFRLGVAKFCRSRRGETLREQDEIVFHNHDTFWQWALNLFKPNQKIYVVSHNLNYDIPILRAISTMKDNDFSLCGEYTNGMVTIIRYEKLFPKTEEHYRYIETDGDFGKAPPKATVIFTDNTNLFAGKLATWGEYLSLPKLTVDFDGEIEQLVTYCHRDVEIMVELWRKWYLFLDEHTGGKFGLTISSTAMNAYRSRFQNGWIHIHDNEDAIKLERASYRGGRTEAFHVGELSEQLFMLDINSMYPHIMKDKPFPSIFRGIVENPPTWIIDYHLERKNMIVADVDIEIQYPLFPYSISSDDTIINLQDAHSQPNLKKNFRDKTCYPVGRFRTTLSTPELKAALLFGKIHKVHAIAHYEGRYLFKKYVEYFYPLRVKFGDAGEVLWKQLTKLLLNSLYGKFGQRGYDEIVVGVADTPEYTVTTETILETNTHIDHITIDGMLIDRTRGGEHWNSFPAIAAHVTAYARLFLYEYILKAGKDNVLYTDTDSLLVTRKGYENLEQYLHPTELGMLKLEKIAKHGVIHAPKDYVVGDKIARKGIKQDATQLSANVFEQTQWPKLRGLRRSGHPETYVTKTITKHLRRFVWSGLIDRNGTVHPFHLQNQ